MACAECGAPQPAGGGCRDCFEALLAFEAERPAVFAAVHHITVATYFLQHPAGYGGEVLTAWRRLIAAALAGAATTRELQRRVGRQFAGERRVRDGGTEIPAGWPRSWPVTVADVLTPLASLPSDDEYVARARAWAASAAETLDAALGA